MTTLQNAPRKQYGLRVFAVILLLLGGVGIYIGSHNFPIRAVGIALVMASTYLIQVSNVRNPAGSPEASGVVSNSKVAKSPGRLLWIASLSLVPALAGAWYLLNLDAANGGHTAWPVDVFAGVGLVCTVVWSLLVVQIRRQGRGN
jgi:hypothetical protein